MGIIDANWPHFSCFKHFQGSAMGFFFFYILLLAQYPSLNLFYILRLTNNYSCAVT